jgi:hypothetical protein
MFGKAGERVQLETDGYDGQVFAMAGATLRHTHIIPSLVIELGAALKAGGVRSSTRTCGVHIPATAERDYREYLEAIRPDLDE